MGHTKELIRFCDLDLTCKVTAVEKLKIKNLNQTSLKRKGKMFHNMVFLPSLHVSSGNCSSSKIVCSKYFLIKPSRYKITRFGLKFD